MKDLIIPILSKDEIDVSQITCDFKGIVIAYESDKAVGYIQYCSGSWYLMSDIDVDSNMDSDNTLINLVTSLIKIGKCTHFTVIEFV